ncbi:MAG: hypothetical protein ACXW3O_00965 [Brevundimonas sp.]
MQYQASQADSAPKPAFEPSDLVDHGNASELTQAGAGGVLDGGSYS